MQIKGISTPVNPKYIVVNDCQITKQIIQISGGLRNTTAQYNQDHFLGEIK
ncbi:MAG: hypothetical protein WBZ36_29790 [Candidatus Nitrosopolaris sp.]